MQLGQLVSPAWATDSSQIPNTVLYVAIIVSSSRQLSLRYGEEHPLTSFVVFSSFDPILFHPRRTPYSTIRLILCPKNRALRIFQIPHHESLLLAHLHPILRLCRLLQRRLLANKPDPLALQLQRDSSRHRRRPSHSHWTHRRSHHFAHPRSHPRLPLRRALAHPNHRHLLSRVFLGAGDTHACRTLRHSLHPRRLELLTCPCGAGVPR